MRTRICISNFTPFDVWRKAELLNLMRFVNMHFQFNPHIYGMGETLYCIVNLNVNSILKKNSNYGIPNSEKLKDYGKRLLLLQFLARF